MNTPRSSATFSSQSSLGGALATFPLRKGRRWAALVAALIFLAAAAGVQIYGLYLACQGWKRYGAAVVGAAISWPLAIAAGLFLLSLACAAIAYANRAKAILLHQNGFAYRDRRGLHPWRWREVAALRSAITRHEVFGIHAGTMHAYTVENRSGEQITLDDSFSRVEELGRSIEENTFPLLFEQAAQQYDSGRNSSFGPVTVSKAGIQVGRKSYAWGEVQRVSIRRGVLRIAQKGGGPFSGAKIALASIPNLRVLVNIIRQVVKIETEN
jgi:hypothetical protein